MSACLLSCEELFRVLLTVILVLEVDWDDIVVWIPLYDRLRLNDHSSAPHMAYTS